MLSFCDNVIEKEKKMTKDKKKETIRVTIDAGTKARAEVILNKLGFTPTQAIDIFYRQIEYHRGIPMEITLPRQTPYLIPQMSPSYPQS